MNTDMHIMLPNEMSTNNPVLRPGLLTNEVQVNCGKQLLSTNAVAIPEPINPPPTTATFLTCLGIKPLSVMPGTCSQFGQEALPDYMTKDRKRRIISQKKKKLKEIIQLRYALEAHTLPKRTENKYKYSLSQSNLTNKISYCYIQNDHIQGCISGFTQVTPQHDIMDDSKLKTQNAFEMDQKAVSHS
ncbi:hypothetical protein EUGRSUZ_H03945 [Eucalyptus grandis]|uniref:Uncharacterized protein n=2 Tax=Eucalyptus grandis TaxID=71139 RepID=A0A059B5I7_EUCGR|nr:hypothetical protein EUGRSUZ_H03945 [Eucalyptus grandis]